MEIGILLLPEVPIQAVQNRREKVPAIANREVKGPKDEKKIEIKEESGISTEKQRKEVRNSRNWKRPEYPKRREQIRMILLLAWYKVGYNG